MLLVCQSAKGMGVLACVWGSHSAIPEEMVAPSALACVRACNGMHVWFAGACVTGRWEHKWGLSNNRSGLRLRFHASREQTIKKER